MKVNSVRSASEFVLEIEQLVVEHDLDYMDAIMLYVEKNGLEVEAVAQLVRSNSTIKDKLQSECEALNLVERPVGKLPM